MTVIHRVRFTNPKEFIINHLIPFILRDHGLGFDMSYWVDDFSDYERQYDGERVPSCNTVCCIGGSIDVLLGPSDLQQSASFLGITTAHTNALFYHWLRYQAEGGYGWPLADARALYNAKTRLDKAGVACALLRRIAEKGDEAWAD
jgi:hypothetical protein